MPNIQLYASQANPHGLGWGMLDFQARRDVVREREQELREMQNSIISESPREAVAEGPRVVKDEAMGVQADRPHSPHELWAIEQKTAAELRETLQYFIDFPTPKNWQKMMELGIPFQLAWMNGRQRVTLHGK